MHDVVQNHPAVGVAAAQLVLTGEARHRAVDDCDHRVAVVAHLLDNDLAIVPGGIVHVAGLLMDEPVGPGRRQRHNENPGHGHPGPDCWHPGHGFTGCAACVGCAACAGFKGCADARAMVASDLSMLTTASSMRSSAPIRVSAAK